MSVDKPMGKTGSAPIKKMGHTHDGQHGSNPNSQPKGRGGVTDLHVPSKKGR